MPDLVELLNENPLVATAFGLVLVAIVAYLSDKIVKRVLLATLDRIVRETAFKFDDLLLQLNVFGRLSHLAPAAVVYYGILFVPNLSDELAALIQGVTSAVIVLVVVSSLAAFLTAVDRTYARSQLAEGRPIGAYIQVTKIAIYVIGGLVFIAKLLDQPVTGMLAGLGALMAVLLLVFRDTILSFVASLQMASYNLVRVGDWIQMDQYGADGDVIELSLHTVKVQNWDKTITAIPTYKLIEQPFRNWRGMKEAGGRRIKRSFFVDMTSIRFLEEAELDRLENFAVLREYIRNKRAELAEYNQDYAHDPSLIVNARRLTNIGTLRAYLERYLQHHSRVHHGMTLMVRQLAPTPEGLPIELYLFTRTTAWVDYEGIQSDIFDHIFSIVPEFGLRVFQAPSGADFQQMSRADVKEIPVAGSRGVVHG